MEFSHIVPHGAKFTLMMYRSGVQQIISQISKYSSLSPLCPDAQIELNELDRFIGIVFFTTEISYKLHGKDIQGVST